MNAAKNLLSSREKCDLFELADKVCSETRSLIVTFCDAKYGHLLDNWLCSLRRLGTLPVLVVALDQTTKEKLESLRVPALLLEAGESLSKIWSLRAIVIHELVAAGFTVTHSDIDAVWLKSPMAMLEKIDADIVSSQGTVHPKAVHSVWGHVLCYGFIQFRPTPITAALLQELAEVARDNLPGAKPFDDQRSLNERLLAMDMNWSVRAPHRIPFRDTSFTCSPSPIVGTSAGGETQMRVVVLPHASVQRVPNDLERSEEIYVRHPLSGKSVGDTERSLRENGCWFLP